VRKKMKTNELTGLALDWAVAKCEGREVKAWAVHRRLGRCDYSTNWAQGGPILEREKIELTYYIGTDEWLATRIGGPAVSEEWGPTPLVAAMRCFVASQLGDDIETPQDIGM
jgi:hypothetical protein